MAKFLSPKGVYDYKLEDYENAIKTNVIQTKNQREAVLKIENEINDRIYCVLKEEGELYAYKRKKAKELMLLQADVFFKNQKKAL